MTSRIISAVSGDQHVPVQAPNWDYANGQKVSFTAAAAQSAVINSPLVRLIATQDCFYTVGDNPTAADAAGSAPLPQMQNWAETITPGQKISVISNGVDGDLFIIPAKTEGGA
jgi:hypothetical protein